MLINALYDKYPTNVWYLVYDVDVTTLRPRQNGQHYSHIFKGIFLNENISILIKNKSLKVVIKGPTDNIPTLVQIMAWRRPGDKPLSEQMVVIFWHIYA